MLRQPGSSYKVGRSATLLKVKTFHDAEAVVLGCGSGEPQPQSGDFDAAEMQATEEPGTDPSERGEPSAPDGEPTEVGGP
jgi:DNA ligase 1